MLIGERIVSTVEGIRLLKKIAAESTQGYQVVDIRLSKERSEYDRKKFGETQKVCLSLPDYLKERSELSQKDFDPGNKNEHLIPLGDLERIESIDQLQEIISNTLCEKPVSLEEVFSDNLTPDKPKFGVFVSPNSIFPNALIVISPGHDQFHHSWELTHFNLNLVNNFRAKGIDIVVIHNEANQSMRTDHDQLAVIEGFEYRSDFESKYFSMNEESSHSGLITRLYEGITKNHSLYSLVYLPDFKMGVVEHKVESWVEKSQIVEALRKFDNNNDNIGAVSYQIFTETAILIYDALKPGAFEMAGNIAVNKSNLITDLLHGWKKQFFEELLESKNQDIQKVLLRNLKIKLQSLCLLFKIDFDVDGYFKGEMSSQNNSVINQISGIIEIISNSFNDNGAIHLSNYYHNIGKTLQESDLLNS